MTLQGRKAVVTGGARGLGACAVSGLLAAGVEVIALDVRRPVAIAIPEGTEHRFRFIECNVSSKHEVDAAFDAAAGAGDIDILVAAAGIDRPGHVAEDIPLEIWEEVMATNARGTFLTNQAACRFMRKRGGRIINFASYAGIRGHGERAAYAAAKGAVLAWTRSAAQAWGRYSITVNAVAPQMRTEVASRYLSTLSDERRNLFLERLRERVPIGGRLGETEHDLLPLILFLADTGSQFMTGQVFAVDGGMTMIGS